MFRHPRGSVCCHDGESAGPCTPETDGVGACEALPADDKARADLSKLDNSGTESSLVIAKAMDMSGALREVRALSRPGTTRRLLARMAGRFPIDRMYSFASGYRYAAT